MRNFLVSVAVLWAFSGAAIGGKECSEEGGRKSFSLLVSMDDVHAFMSNELLDELHGTAKPNLEGLKPRDAAKAREALPYARDVSAALGADQNYLENTKAAQARFRAWWPTWMKNTRRTEGQWREMTEERHRTAAGVGRGTAYRPEHDTYKSDDETVGPGMMRSRKPEKREGNVHQAGPKLIDHIHRWLKAQNLPDPDRTVHRMIEVRGMAELLRKSRRKLINENFDENGLQLLHYPHDLDSDLFEQLSFARLNEVADLIKQVENAKAKGERISKALKDQTLDAMADYYHTAILGHVFGKLNNSMLIPEMNVLLEDYLGMKPMIHGSLDLVAIRMDYGSFRKYFRQYVDRFFGES